MTTPTAWLTAIILTLALVLGMGGAELLARVLQPVSIALMGG